MNIADEFPLDPGIIYLNHAAVAPWPRRTTQAVINFARENSSFGAQFYSRWVAVEQRLREQLQQLINAPHIDDIALLKSTSEGLSFIASGLAWNPGDEIIITNQEFSSNRIPWEALARQGVVTHLADIGCDNPEQAILDLISPRTRLISVSSVQYGTGLRLNLEPIGKACRENAIYFCVDAIQSLGAIPLDVTAIHADFVVADGHKWMLGPEGLALFYCRAEIREHLRPSEYGWHMLEHSGDYDRTDWQIAASARRYECGSPNMLGAHALSASLSLLLDVGINEIQLQIAVRTDQIISALVALDCKVLTPLSTQRRGGIVTFQPGMESVETCYERLKNAGIICARRGGGIRLSPHFYTPEALIDQAMAIVASA